MYSPLAEVFKQSGIDPRLAQASSFVQNRRPVMPRQQMFTPPQQIQSQQQQNIDPLRREIQNIAKKNLKYSMDRGPGCTDCSAFTRDVFKNAYGKDIGEWTGEQQNVGTTVTDGNYRNGDLIFTSPDNGKRTGGISHVGIYDNGNVIDFSSANGGGVRTTPLSQYYKPWKVQRIL